MLKRHGHELTGKLGDMVKELDENAVHFGPNTVKMLGRMLSASLSPVPERKLPPKEAMEALESFTYEHLPERKRARTKSMTLQKDAEQQAAEAMQAKILKEIARRDAFVKRKRAVGSPHAPERKKRDNYGDLVPE